MVQRVKLCVVLLAFALLVSVSGMWLITYRCNELSEDISRARETYYSGDKERALFLMDAVVMEWERDCQIFSCFVTGEKLFELNASIARLTPFMEDDNDELSAEFMTVLGQLDRIRETEAPHIYNIL